MTVSPDFAAYETKLAGTTALHAEILPLNKAALFDALQAGGIHLVVVSFDGCGDSGQIESVTAFAPDNSEMALPAAMIELRDVVFSDLSISSDQRTIREIVEVMAYDLLRQTHDGWENSDGAFGEFTFNVAERSITLDYNERYTESTNHQHEF